MDLGSCDEQKTRIENNGGTKVLVAQGNCVKVEGVTINQ